MHKSLSEHGMELKIQYIIQYLCLFYIHVAKKCKCENTQFLSFMSAPEPSNLEMTQIMEFCEQR